MMIVSSAASSASSRSRSRSLLLQVVAVVAVFNLALSVGIVHAQNVLDGNNDDTNTATATATATATGAAELYSRTTACDAQYNAPCSRFNSQVLARETALQLSRELLVEGNSNTPAQVFDKVNSGQYNVDVGFYPFVFERTTGIAMAHGSNPNFTGKTLKVMLEGTRCFVLVWFVLCLGLCVCYSQILVHLNTDAISHVPLSPLFTLLTP